MYFRNFKAEIHYLAYLDTLRYFALALSGEVALALRARAQKKMVRLRSRSHSDPKNNALK